MNDIVPKEIAGGAVYGVKQYEYTVDGTDGHAYAEALATAAFRESVAIEDVSQGYSVVVRERQRKVDELSEILSLLAKAQAKLPVKDQSTNDAVSIDNAAWVNATASKYGITLVFKENTDQMTRGSIQNGQNDVQYAIDVEDNNLQQDMVSLQSYISKRDNSYSTAAKIIKKAIRTASGTISNIR